MRFGHNAGMPVLPSTTVRRPLSHCMAPLLLALFCGVAWLGALDQAATRHADAGLQRAAASFAAARAPNALISVAQGTQLAVQPAAIGTPLAETVDVGKHFAQLQESACHAVDRLVDLIVVCVRQTVALPIARLWLLARRRARASISPVWPS